MSSSSLTLQDIEKVTFDGYDYDYALVHEYGGTLHRCSIVCFQFIDGAVDIISVQLPPGMLPSEYPKFYKEVSEAAKEHHRQLKEDTEYE